MQEKKLIVLKNVIVDLHDYICRDNFFKIVFLNPEVKSNLDLPTILKLIFITQNKHICWTLKKKNLKLIPHICSRLVPS